MSDQGEREVAPEVEVEDGPEVETEVEETTEETEGEEEAEPEEPAEPAEGAEPAAPAKPRSAATIAVQEAKRRAKEAEARAEAAERRAAEIERERQGRQTAEEQRLEAERVALMSPDERTAHEVGKVRREFDARFGALQFQTQDSSDRAAFESACNRVPAYAAIQQDVERALAQARREGNNPLRETVAKYLIGERAVQKALNGGANRQKAKGRENIQRQTVKQPSGRSDVRPAGERAGADTAAARQARLENKYI